ncbi:hypothetical protein BD626DRAFT_541643 [Schizophyllum amplum]|uniref:Uncharacterized protein n=1 Tax=Schizophyllum amplum TaxID=97359 RepID=A0A550BTU4_9AGAR|nr:hypothetical protein BD626DRAFT_541643 [Auriculariopsis ampla]
MLLPSTCDDAIFSCLNPQDIAQYAAASRTTYNQCRDFYQRAYDLNRALSRYFSKGEVAGFRQMQRSTGLVISGSFALQRIRVSPQCGGGFELPRILGYEYRKRLTQSPDFHTALAMHPTLTRDDKDAAMYPGEGIAGAFNFVKISEPSTIIQLITARTSPVDIILGFHSTAVMNMITHAGAVSLYPRETFANNRSLRLWPSSPKIDAGIQKYHQRGFTINTQISAAESGNNKREFGRSYRFVGDDMTWVLALQRDSEQEKDDVMWQSWTLRFNATHTLAAHAYNEDARVIVRYLKEHPLAAHHPDTIGYTFADVSIRKAFRDLVAAIGTTTDWTSYDSNAVAEEICQTVSKTRQRDVKRSTSD